MTLTKEQLEQMVQSVPNWWHSIDLGNGVVTKGHKSPAQLAYELKSLRLPNLQGKSVLDIGAWDGFFSFAAERMGAKRVLALDHYVWSFDLPEAFKYWADCKERGIIPKPNLEMPFYRPSDLLGKQGFDTASHALNSNVEAHVADFMTMDLAEIGTFDVVLYLGVLYHMENPFEALKRVAAVTKELAIVETEAVAFPVIEHHAVCEFFESNELQGDVSNWWAPNEKAVGGMCRAAGFRHVDTIVGLPRTTSQTPRLGSKLAQVKSSLRHLLPRSSNRQDHPRPSPEVIRYRAFFHAWK